MCINICIFIQEVHENIDNSSPHTEEHNPHAHQHREHLMHNTEHHGSRKGRRTSAPVRRERHTEHWAEAISYIYMNILNLNV